MHDEWISIRQILQYTSQVTYIVKSFRETFLLQTFFPKPKGWGQKWRQGCSHYVGQKILVKAKSHPREYQKQIGNMIHLLIRDLSTFRDLVLLD